MPKTWRLLLIFGSLSLLSLLLWRSPPDGLSGFLLEPQATERIPTSYLTNSVTTQFSATGSIAYTVESTLVNYFADDHQQLPDVTMDKPVFMLFKEQDTKAPWRVSSNYGEGKEAQDLWLLTGQVLLEHQRTNNDDANVDPATLSTEELRISPGKRYAETNKPVTITDSSGTTEAVGLKVFFDDDRIEFLSNVKSRYHINKP